jgi:hypothetical protein
MPHSPSESNSPKDNHDLINTSFYDGNGTGMSSTLIPILDVHKGRPVRLQVKVMVPVHDHPNVSPFIFIRFKLINQKCTHYSTKVYLI